MQKITRDALIEKAESLLSNGTVVKVLGWKKGEFDYDVTPAIFTSAEEMKKDFVYDAFAASNVSKYLVKETRSTDGKILVFLKPCDTYSFNQLLTEHRFDREKVYVVGIACDGKADVNKIKELAGDGIISLTDNGDKIVAKTLYNGEKTFELKDVLLERCANCKSKKQY